MADDPNRSRLDITDAQSAGSSHGRPYLSVNFACCGVYQRIYRSPDGSCYAGRCPRCARPVTFKVGQGGTSARFFTVS